MQQSIRTWVCVCTCYSAGTGASSAPHDTALLVALQDFLLEFLLDLYNPDSPRALMYAAMPRPHKLRHQLNFPQQYLPLLQHKDLVSEGNSWRCWPRLYLYCSCLLRMYHKWVVLLLTVIDSASLLR